MQCHSLFAQYEEASVLRDMSKQTTPTFQRRFLEKVQRLASTLGEMGNPFQEGTGDLLNLDTKGIASPCSANRIATTTNLSTGDASFEVHLETLKHEDTSSFTNQEDKNGLLSARKAQHRCQR